MQHVSPHQVRLAWEPASHLSYDYGTVTVIRLSSATAPFSQGATKKFQGNEGSCTLQNLTPGCKYTVHIVVRKKGALKERASLTFRNWFSIQHIQQLHERAAQFQGEPQNFKQIQYMYRNKPYGYYNPVRFSSLRIEFAYRKDFNGDPANPINGMITGLFFSGQLSSTGSFDSASPFGPCRLVMPVQYLVNSSSNFYFADFYCNTARHQHYVTVVIATPGTLQDDYCSHHLPALHPRTNPYLILHPDGSVWLNHSPNLRVEVFYCGNIDTTKGYFTHTQTFGRGQSSPTGLAKMTDCHICNLTI